MTRHTSLRRLTIAFALAPLALGLAACGKDEEAAGPSGEPIAKIAPPAGKTWAETMSVTPEGGYKMGNPNAPIKLVEYGALSCSHCAEFSETGSAELRDKFVADGRVSYELRLYMLNALDVPAALLTTCGPSEAVVPLADQFWGWQRNMFDNLQKAGPAFQAVADLPPEKRFAEIARLGGMDEFFAARGIPADKAKTCLADTNKASALVAATTKAAEEMKITGTPTFFLNGSRMDGNTWPVVKAALERAGARDK